MQNLSVAKTKITQKDLFEFRNILELALSPTGEFAAFVVKQAIESTNNYSSDIWIYNTGDKTVSQLTHTGSSQNLLWLNDHELLSGSQKVVNGRPVTEYKKLPIDGSVSSVYMIVPTYVNSIQMIDENRFAIGGLYSNTPASDFSSDFDVFNELPYWVNGLGHFNKNRLPLFAFNREQNTLLPITSTYAVVTIGQVKNSKIYYAAEEYRDIRPAKQGVFCYDFETNTNEMLLEEKDFRVHYVFETNNEVYFIGTDEKRYGVNQNADLYQLTDKGPIRVLKLPNCNDSTNGFIIDSVIGSSTIFSAVDSALYFLSSNHTASDLCKVNFSSRKLKSSDIEVVAHTSGVLHGFSVSGNKLLALSVEADRLSEICEIENNALVATTNFNTDYINSRYVNLPEYTEMNYMGEIIEGFIIKPIDFEEGMSYPGVLCIHGGPKGIYGPGFSHEMQLFSSKGYFVFYCNPKGSDGRGNRFTDIREKQGITDYNQIMAFTDHVLNQYPELDDNNLIVNGGSYGGFLVNWIIGHTNRFRCCSSQRCVSNWFADFLTSDIGYYYQKSQFKGDPWERDGEKYWDQSPVKYADKVTTPTLFIHSEKDYRCFEVQALEMFTALKYFGVDTRLVVFKGENHGLAKTGKPSNRVRSLDEISKWFESHID